MDNILSTIIEQYEQDKKEMPSWTWKDALALFGICVLTATAVVVLLLQIASLP